MRLYHETWLQKTTTVREQNGKSMYFSYSVLAESDLGHAKEPPPVAGTQNVLRIGCPSCKFDKTKRVNY